jgi:alkylhydroperoxidase family enzyme
MSAELDQLRALATVIGTAEATLDAAYAALRGSASALLATGTSSLAEVREASGLSEAELLDLLTVAADDMAFEHMFHEGPPGPGGRAAEH